MKKIIIALKLQGKTNDFIYDYFAGLFGLYGVAFFGHKGTKAQKQKLNYVWKLILNN